MRELDTDFFADALARLHEALDLEALAASCGSAVEALGGLATWRLRLCASSSEKWRGEFAGVGSALAPASRVPDGPCPYRVALRFRQETVGNLEVWGTTDPDDPRWRVLGEHMGSALVNLQLWMEAEKESCHRRMAEEVLGDISVVIGSFDVEFVLARTLEQLLRIVGSEVGSILLWDGQRLTTSVVLGLPEELTRGVRMDGAPVAQRAAEAGEALIVENPEVEGVPEALAGARLDALVVVPLVSHTRVVGVFQAANPMFTDARSPSFAAAEGVCRLAAVAVENALLHREAVQRERLATIGQVMAGLSHDIKNMLQSMKAGYYLLRMGAEKNDLESVGEAVPLIGLAMDRISGLVLDMLNYSKSRVPQRRPTSLNALGNEIVVAMQPLAAERSVHLSLVADPGMQEIPADSTGIYRCLSNLVTNAVEAVAEGGRVDVLTAWCEDSPTAEIRVADDGPGIEREDQERVFDALFSKKGNKGTGLGLAVTKKIVEEHGGRIDLESEPGQGASFTIRLPKTP